VWQHAQCDIKVRYRKSFTVGGDAKGDFILVKLARKRSISHYTSEVMKDFHGYEYEISCYKQLENTSKFIHNKENEYFSILSCHIMETSTPLPVGLFKCQASHLCFPFDFSAFNLK
jgi:hypothetical protein